jgi:predicted Holliday junction resolvase-like endonuclease
MSPVYDDLQEFRKILCVCPCCGDLVRVSDLRLKAKGRGARTWLDEYQTKLRLLERREERFEERVKALRQKAQELGRKESQRIVRKAMIPQFRAMKLDPQDVKPIMSPVDFVVFKGMTQRAEVDRILFLSRKSAISQVNGARAQVQAAVKARKYSWQVARIDEGGKMEID